MQLQQQLNQKSKIHNLSSQLTGRTSNIQASIEESEEQKLSYKKNYRMLKRVRRLYRI